MVKVLHEELPARVAAPIALGTETVITLDAVVGEDGVAYAIRPLPGDNEGVPPALLVMSVGTVSAWRFEPATVLGCPVPTAVHIRITHRLR